MSDNYELIICIVNSGYCDMVMDVARLHGATGGTVINARGTAREDSLLDLNIQFHPEKDVVLILVRSEIKNDILHGLYKEVGLDTKGQGIVFTLPVSDVAGIANKEN
ncbi:MAG: P-II family nitrogen regulator [Anaeroplasmataceae bacterium]